jgi:hypothetical protein
MTTLLGGRSRPECAATLPPDQFWCALDRLPVHLIPGHLDGRLTTKAGDRLDLCLNPNVEVCAPGEVPEVLASYSPCLKRFALQRPIAWVRQPVSEALMPFWLSSRLEKALASMKEEDRIPSWLNEEELSILLAAGIVRSKEQTGWNGERYREAMVASAEMFQARDYAPIRGTLIHPFHVAALRRYFRYLIRSGKIRLGDDQSSRRYVAHNESVARFFHQQMAKAVSLIAGQAVVPSYVYVASYLSGAELKKHTDREQCEFSVTFCLDFSPEPKRETSWPICLETASGKAKVYQALGDGLVYRGTRVPHYRRPLSVGKTSTSIFFHYVSEGFAGSLD